jgi:solute carrier family 35 protein E3
MRLFLIAGMFQHKSLRSRQVLPLAAAYVGYIVLCNLSLKVNTVGFYQVGVRCGVLGIFGSDVV